MDKRAIQITLRFIEDWIELRKHLAQEIAFVRRCYRLFLANDYILFRKVSNMLASI